MSEQQSLVNVFTANTKPFRAYTDDADCIVVQPASFGPPPTFQVLFGKYVPSVPAKAAVKNNGALDLPDIPAITEVPAMFKTQRTEIIILSQDEWDNWDKSQTDKDYLAGLAAKRFGLTLI